MFKLGKLLWKCLCGSEVRIVAEFDQWLGEEGPQSRAQQCYQEQSCRLLTCDFWPLKWSGFVLQVIWEFVVFLHKLLNHICILDQSLVGLWLLLLRWMASECLGNAEYLNVLHGHHIPPRTSPGGLLTVQSLLLHRLWKQFHVYYMISHCSDYRMEFICQTSFQEVLFKQ